MSLCRIIDARCEDPFAVLRLRQIAHDEDVEGIVRRIIEDVRARGDAALLDNARRFDAPSLASILVSDEEFANAELSERFQTAMGRAAERIEQFHTLQLAHFTQGLSPEAGTFGWEHNRVGQRVLALSSVGAYVPGGKATYPSSVLMNVIPAKVAGVTNIVVTTPARPDGSLAPSVLCALKICGVDKAFKIGGAAAVAALALGTESVTRVDKIVGPGNKYVNEAKRQLWGRVGLDGYAGPSEVCVLVDADADSEWAAADLLTQIEHSEDNAAFLVATDEAKLHSVLEAAERQLKGAQCETSMRQALSGESLAFIASSLDQAVDIINAIAPEHLSILTKSPEIVCEHVQNAGCILLGEFTPESAGDFALGPSHTLPTSGAARFGSPVNVLDFLKIQSISRLEYEQLQDLIPIIEAFGEMEGFPAHARGATIRLVR